MEAHQERVLTEKSELDVKINKLESFFNGNDIYNSLPLHEQALLTRQLTAMKEYSAILHERIIRWK